MEKATSEKSQILETKVNAIFNKEKAYDELWEADKEYKNASSAASRAWGKYKKLQIQFSEALEGDWVTDGLRDDIEKARKRYDITSARKAKASIAKQEARTYYYTHGQARTRDEQFAYLEKSQAEIRAYLAKEKAIDKEAGN